MTDINPEKEKILVVDGDPSILDSVTAILSKSGYGVHTCQTAAETMRWMEKEVPDLILLAVKLPDTDGLELCRQFRVLESTRQIPVVFLSSLKETGDIVRAFSSGASDYMIKPFRERELVSRIQTHLSRSQIRKQLEQKNVELKNEIVGRVRVEEKLRESENLLRTVIENLPFDFFVIGRDGRYIMQNATCRRNWGNVVGRHPRDVSPDEETLKLWESNNQRAFDGEMVKGEELVHLPEGDKYIYNIVSPIRDGDNITGIMGINIDITERRWVEERLEETKTAKGKLTKLINESPHPVMKLSQEGTVLFANPACGGILDHWKCRVGEPPPEPILSKLQSAFQTPEKSEIKLALGNGATVTITLVPDPEESTLTAYGVFDERGLEGDDH